MNNSHPLDQSLFGLMASVMCICDEHAHVEHVAITNFDDSHFLITLSILGHEIKIAYFEDTRRLVWPDCFFFMQPSDCKTHDELGLTIFNCIAQTINNLMPTELRWSHPNFMNEIREISETRVDELLGKIPEFDGTKVFNDPALSPHSLVCYNKIAYQPAYFDNTSPINSWPIFMKIVLNGERYLVNTYDGASSFLVHNWLKLV
jgi:hypothetical protein